MADSRPDTIVLEPHHRQTTLMRDIAQTLMDVPPVPPLPTIPQTSSSGGTAATAVPSRAYSGSDTDKSTHAPLDHAAPRPCSASCTTSITSLNIRRRPIFHAHAVGAEADKIRRLRDGPLSIRHLWQPLAVRQYMQGGKLYREVGKRRVSRFELFGDLSMSGVANVLAEGPAEQPDVVGLAKFLICFWPAWSIWRDVRDFSSVSGTDDIKMRLYILVNMFLMYGYTANIALIEIEKTEFGAQYELPETSYEAIKAASLFFMAAKGLRILTYLYYAYFLPKFSKSLCLSALAMFCNTGLYVAIPMIRNKLLLLILPCLAIGGDLYARYLLVLVSKIHHFKLVLGTAAQDMCIPAIDLDHALERTCQLMIVIYGELVMTCLYVAKESQIGARQEFIRSGLGICIASNLIWLYFDSDSSRTFVHAMRRNWFTSISFVIVQYPLAAATIILSSALHVAVQHDAFPPNLKFFFAGGVSFSVMFIAILGSLHKGLDLPNSGLLPRSVRLGLRYLVSVVLSCVPYYPQSTTMAMTIVASILTGLVIVETVAKIGSVRLDTLHHEQMLDPNRRTFKHWHRHKEDLTDVEKGQEDVGTGEGEIGEFEVKEIHMTQRLAYAA